MVNGILNPTHVVFLLVIVLMLFGAKRLPELGRSLGAGMRGFKESITGQDASPQLDAASVAAAERTPAEVNG